MSLNELFNIGSEIKRTAYQNYVTKSVGHVQITNIQKM